MTEVPSLIEQGVAHLNGQRFPEAAQSFLAAIARDARQEQAWLGLAVALALAGQLGDFVQLAGHRQKLLGDGFLFFHAALGALMGYRLHRHVEAIAGMLPDDNPFAAPAAYHAGCALLLDGQEDGAFGWFGKFKARIAGRADTLPIGPESHFNVAYRQGTLIEDRAYVAALDDLDPRAARPPPPVFTAPPVVGPREAILAAACDGRYFQHFAPGLVASARRQMPGATLHFHVIEPADGTAALLAELATSARDLALNLSTEGASPFKSGAYYASSRFLVGPALMARYPGRPLVLLDVDIEFVAPLDDLLAAASPFDFACFRHDGAGPCSRYPAVLTHWMPTPGSARLLDRVGRFVRSKLEVRWPFNWMLDQAALSAVLRWARADRPEIALGILNDLTGKHFQPWLRSVGGDEKAEMIRAAR